MPAIKRGKMINSIKKVVSRKNSRLRVITIRSLPCKKQNRSLQSHLNIKKWWFTWNCQLHEIRPTKNHSHHCMANSVISDCLKRVNCHWNARKKTTPKTEETYCTLNRENFVIKLPLCVKQLRIFCLKVTDTPNACSLRKKVAWSPVAALVNHTLVFELH